MIYEVFVDWCIYHTLLCYAPAVVAQARAYQAAFASAILPFVLYRFPRALYLRQHEPDVSAEQATVVSLVFLVGWHFVYHLRCAPNFGNFLVLAACVAHETLHREDSLLHQCLMVVGFFSCLMYFAGSAGMEEWKSTMRAVWVGLLVGLWASLVTLLCMSIYNDAVYMWVNFAVLAFIPILFPLASADKVGGGTGGNALSTILINNQVYTYSGIRYLLLKREPEDLMGFEEEAPPSRQDAPSPPLSEEEEEEEEIPPPPPRKQEEIPPPPPRKQQEEPLIDLIS